MGWLSFLFGSPFEPPTEKQLRFAAALGITVTKRMSKQDVSAAISAKQAADPKTYGKASGKLATGSRRAEAVVGGPGLPTSGADAKWLKTPEGREVTALYKRWARIVESEPYGIFVYRQPVTGRIELDVARVSAADCDHDESSRVRVILDVSLPKTARDPQTGGEVLEWCEHLDWYPAADVLLWHKLPESFGDVEGCSVGRDATTDDRRQLKRYEAAIEKGREMAKEKGITISR